MSFPPYPSYRDSGVEWIGPVPADWSVYPLLAVADECDRSNRGMVEDNLLSLSYGSIVRKDINTSDGLLPESFETYQVVEPNDIVWRLTDLQNDKRSLRTAIVRERGIITSAYLATQPHGVSPAFLSYLLRAYDQEKVFYSMGGGLRQSMKYADVRRMPIIVPSEGEQAAIAAFLDRETAKIDALVEEQRRLIELLKEKRQAVNSHAVTKGLDPTVPMKDSGVEWLGQVPAHWDVVRLRNLWSNVKAGPFGSSITKDMYVADGIRVYGQEQVIAGDFSIGDYYISEEDFSILSAYEVFPGDVLISCVGTFGKIAIVPKGIERGIINPRLIRLRSNDRIRPEYLATVLKSEVAAEQLSASSRGGTMEVINIGVLSGLVLPIPPLNEQQSIDVRVEELEVEFEALIVEATASISLLQERRAALISAAVTGKIDVGAVATRRAEAA